MKGNEHMKTLSNTVYGTFALLASYALLPQVQAVNPAPDGGYPGQNTAEGQNALFSLTTGTSNTANGYEALKANTTGHDNPSDCHVSTKANRRSYCGITKSERAARRSESLQ